MILYSYIPIKPVLEKLGMDFEIGQNAYAPGYIISNPSVFDEGDDMDMVQFQFIPENIEFTVGSNYIEAQAKGTNPLREYNSNKLDKTSFSFYFVDSVQTQEGDLPMPFNADNIIPTLNYFKALTRPTLTTNIPPEVTFQFGEITFTGQVDSCRQKIIKTYPDGTPLIVQISLDMTGEYL